MVKLASIFEQFGPAHVLVIGDLMLDTYTIGKVRRISPEAPVPVLHVTHEEKRAGGAGNVVLNLLSLGCDVDVVGRIGSDAAGKELVETLRQSGAQVSGVVVQEDWPTSVKNRIIADQQQIVRVDTEVVLPIAQQSEQMLLDQIPKLLENIQVVAISDYGKGFLSKVLLQALIEAAAEKKIPVITDPKGQDFSKYAGSTILKPNLSEAIAASGLESTEDLSFVAAEIHKQVAIGNLMITRSADGISLFPSEGEKTDFAVSSQEIKDVTGAGDTVLAMLSYALANGIDLHEAIALSNVAAGIAIEHLGCARVTLSDLAKRLLRNNSSTKVFNSKHLFAVRAALEDAQVAMLVVDSSVGLVPELFRKIRVLAEKKDHKVVVYVNDLVPDPEFVQTMASMIDVACVILKDKEAPSIAHVIPTSTIHQVETATTDRSIIF